MRTTWLIALALAGCGGGSLTDLEGIYSVSSWTRNPTACDAEGPAVTTQDAFFYIKAESFLGTEFVNVVTCADLTECRTEATDKGTIHLGGFTFEEGSDGDGWRSRNGFAFEIQGQCEGSVHEVVMTASGGTVRIEDRRTEAVPFPPDAQNECPDDKLDQAVAGQPCGELEVVTATFDSSY